MENLGFLNIDEQVRFNDINANYSMRNNFCKVFGGAVFAGSFVYYLVKMPLTKTLGKETMKSTVFGVAAGFLGFLGNTLLYKREIHPFYIKVIKEKIGNTEEESA